jgi:hypothetical protein
MILPIEGLEPLKMALPHLGVPLILLKYAEISFCGSVLG